MPDAPQGLPRAVRLPSLTGMRFVAAFLVFAFHVSFQTRFISGGTGDFLSTAVAKAGFYGVCFFFVLSGFVLTWSARAGDTAPRIWRRRLVKIYPNHLVGFVLAAVLMTIAAQPIAVGDAVSNLFLVQTWWPDIAAANSMNAVSWSLACELFFYLCFPLLLRGLNALPVRLLWSAVAVVAALALAAPLVGQYAISDHPLLPFIDKGQFSFTQIWFVYFFPPVRALEFVLGMLVARIVQTGHWPRIGLLPAAAIAAAGYAVTSNVPYLFSVAGAASLWLVPLVAAAAVADRDGLRSPFRTPALVRLGELSFAFYMVHGLVVSYGYLWTVQGHHWSLLPSLGLLLAAFAASLALALAMFTWVESPAVRHFSNRRPTRREAATRPVAASVRMEATE
jgi:peptidoglycan/LPS O-acetylase OafA/YrhL